MPHTQASTQSTHSEHGLRGSKLAEISRLPIVLSRQGVSEMDYINPVEGVLDAALNRTCPWRQLMAPWKSASWCAASCRAALTSAARLTWTSPRLPMATT